jgi:hypothetical protein
LLDNIGLKNDSIDKIIPNDKDIIKSNDNSVHINLSNPTTPNNKQNKDNSCFNSEIGKKELMYNSNMYLSKQINERKDINPIAKNKELTPKISDTVCETHNNSVCNSYISLNKNND